MKSGTIVMMTALLNLGAVNLGVAHADTMKSNPGFDRVGMVSSEKQRAPGERGTMPSRIGDAPGETIEASVSNYPARKREMARRLVWLMLSAR